MTVTEIFAAAGLQPCGPVLWKEQVPETSEGIYVVALVEEAGARLECPVYGDYLPPGEKQRWLPTEPVVYIGQTRGRLTGRLEQFYRHIHGCKSPHRGGQAVKLLRCRLWVYWSPTTNPKNYEQIMLDAFEKQVGQLPFANRRH